MIQAEALKCSYRPYWLSAKQYGYSVATFSVNKFFPSRKGSAIIPHKEAAIMATYKVNPEVSPRNQPTSTTCWLTCLQMLFHKLERSATRNVQIALQSVSLLD